MASKGRWRWLVPTVAVLFGVAALLLVAATRNGLFHRFDAHGMKINPRAHLRPDVAYTLVVWEEAVPAPWAQITQAQVLEAAIKEFTELHPNVYVQYELVDAATARERLSASFEEGRPPDVYGAARAASWPLPYQVPATPYMPASTSENSSPYLTAVENSLAAEGSVWGWPRAFWWDGWLARRDAVVKIGVLDGSAGDDASAGTNGVTVRWDAWRYDAIAEAARRQAADGGLRLILDVSGLSLLEQLTQAPRSSTNPDDGGYRLWDQRRLVEAVMFVQALQSAQRPDRDPAAASRSRFAALNEDRADIVAPANVYAAQSALRRDPEELIILPPPTPAASRPVLPIAASAYFVFRQHEYKGDDHTRAAVELAAFLAAKTETWLVEAVGLLPARDAGWDAWRERSPWNTVTRAVLEEASAYATPVRTLPPETTEQLHAALLPIWQSFLAGDTTPEQFSEKASEEAERVLESKR